MRVNVQLIEAESGAHLWGERFGKPVADLFDMQDEIVSRLANQLRGELIDAEARRAARAPNPDSMDFYFQGQALLSRGFAPDILAEARKFFLRALEQDPSNIDALVGVGLVDMLSCTLYMTDDPATIAVTAETRLVKALALAPNCAPAHATMGGLLINTNRAQRGIEEFERALALDPNLARARAGIGLAHVFIGRAEETEAHVLEALRLSPATRESRIGFSTPAEQRHVSGNTRQPSCGLENRSTPTGTTPGLISTWPPALRTSVASTTRENRWTPASASIRNLQFAASARACKATTPPISPSARASSKACAWPERRKSDHPVWRTTTPASALGSAPPKF
jgi:tetratricopeptide (TPR) repeat protein